MDPQTGVPGTGQSAAPIRKSPLGGERFAHYRIIGPLGAGGMGEVYRARDEHLQRDVAIKLLPAATFGDAVARARLLQEARAAAALNHPNLCTIHQVGEADGQPFIAMELVEGRTLAAMLADGALPHDLVMDYARQLTEGLAHAHGRGVVHRDLKSANVIVSAEGRLKILDFGLAKRTPSAADATATLTSAHPQLTELGSAMGTLGYMAPEQLRGHAAQTQSDVWALGVILYEMAAGRRPFVGLTEYEVSAAILSETPVASPPVPEPLRGVIRRCLSKDPAGRYVDGRQAQEALSRAVPAADVAPPTDTQVSRPGRRDTPRRPIPVRRRSLVALLAALVAIAAGFGIWQLRPGGVATRSLAVLPFLNPANDEQLEYLCNGIADTLIKQISTHRALKVTPLRATFNLKGQGADGREAGRRLGVDTILSGTLTRRGARLAITAQLVDVASGAQLWTKTYESDAAELLKVQDQIGAAIMDDGLDLRLTGEERLRLVRHPTEDAEAYDLYLQARHSQRGATEEDYLHARTLLHRALVRDQKFAVAYSSLAGTYAMMAADGLERPNDAWPQANRYMRQALQLEPDLSEAHAIAHALAFLFYWDWAAAEQERRFITRSSAGDLDPIWMRALALERWALGEPAEALKLARRARELDPLSHDLAMLEADYLGHSGAHDAAIALYERSIRLEPTNPNSHFGLAEALFRTRRFDEAIAARQRAHATAGDESLKALFSTARGEEGYRQIDLASVRTQLGVLKERETTGYVSPLDFARAYAQLGDKPAAFRYLDAAFADRAAGLVFLNVDRAWDLIRSDPRFAAAVTRVGLPEPKPPAGR